MNGWLPLTLQILAAVLLVAAIGWRTRRWRLLWLPVAVVVGVAAAFAAMAYVAADGLATDPAPTSLWIWTGVAAGAVAVLVLGWRSARWWRRGVSVLAVPLTLVCVGLVLNQWVGYFPTVQEAWGAVTAGPLPDEVPEAQLTAMQGVPRSTGAVVGVTIPDTASDFVHREEYVYLPPAYFTSTDHRSLPVVMMIAGEFNTPADWIRIGNAVPITDQYARAHNGVAPILVFVDAGGTFNNDTECVDGPRGNAADHLTGDVRPYLVSRFGASADPAKWGIVGWSMGGTCAVDLAVMHPDLFSTFTDIAGDLGPTVGTKDQTIAKLYGGNAAAWAHFDPMTVLAGHAPYPDTAGWFDDSSGGGGRPGARGQRPAGQRPAHPGWGGPAGGGADSGLGGHYGAGAGGGGNQTAEADQLCAAATKDGIQCSVHLQPGGHTWQFASGAFADALPWMAGRLQGTPQPAAAAPPSSS
nr:alpha/beta hydrolase-fold protein [Pseudonocardia acidicola]